jgi:hypothetical protein
MTAMCPSLNFKSIFNGHGSVNIAIKVMIGHADAEHLTLLNEASGYF